MMMSRGRPKPVLTLAWSVLLSLAGAAVLAGCGGGNSSDRSIEWVVFKQLGPRTVKLAAEVEYCIGTPNPEISRAKTEYSGDRVSVSLYLAAPLDTYRADNCRGVIKAVFKTIRLKRGLADVEMFDMSTSPPE